MLGTVFSSRYCRKSITTQGIPAFASLSMKPESRAPAYASKLRMTTSGSSSIAFSSENCALAGLPKMGISATLGNFALYRS